MQLISGNGVHMHTDNLFGFDLANNVSDVSFDNNKQTLLQERGDTSSNDKQDDDQHDAHADTHSSTYDSETERRRTVIAAMKSDPTASLVTRLCDIEMSTTHTIRLLVQEMTPSTTRKGQPFVLFSVSDGYGKYECRKWMTHGREVEHLLGHVVYARVYCGDYNGRPSYVINDIVQDVDDSAIDELMLEPPMKSDDMYEWIMSQLNEMSRDDGNVDGSGYVASIAKRIYEENKAALMTWGAAHGVHHAFNGGLMYHSYRMCKDALALADVYDGTLDKELLFCGAALHDIGKLSELDTNEFGASEYTLGGSMLGHSLIGVEMVERAVADMAAESGIGAQDDDDIKASKRQERLLVLKHMIASHHGKQEYGAIAKPCVAEAMALHIIDLLDSRMEIFEEEMVNVQPCERAQSGNYALDGVRVYRTSWAKVRE